MVKVYIATKEYVKKMKEMRRKNASLFRIYRFFYERSNLGEDLLLNTILIVSEEIKKPYNQRQVSYFRNKAKEELGIKFPRNI